MPGKTSGRHHGHPNYLTLNLQKDGRIGKTIKKGLKVEGMAVKCTELSGLDDAWRCERLEFCHELTVTQPRLHRLQHSVHVP